MVNLLPEKTKSALALGYYVRLGSFFALFLATGIFASTVLLIPSYFFVGQESDAANRYLAASQKTLAIDKHTGAKQTLSVLSERVNILKGYARDPVVRAIFSNVVTASDIPQGISVTKIDVTPQPGAKGTMTIGGKADTRDNLLAFVDALRQAGPFQSVSVPVEALAGEKDIPFSMTFSFALTHQ